MCVCFIEGLSVLIFFNHALFELNKGTWFNYSDSGLLGHLDMEKNSVFIGFRFKFRKSLCITSRLCNRKLTLAVYFKCILYTYIMHSNKSMYVS